jgi:ribosomal protein S18 acetylase RimI-like enzyme
MIAQRIDLLCSAYSTCVSSSEHQLIEGAVSMSSHSPNLEPTVRLLQYRDWDVAENLLSQSGDPAERSWLSEPIRGGLITVKKHPLLKAIETLPLGIYSSLRTYVLEQGNELLGLIQVTPFNQSRSTWRVERICLAPGVSSYEVGSQMLRFCLENIWEARTWLVETEVNAIDGIGLYRKNGFQPLIQMTRWQLSPERLAVLAEHQPMLPNFLPISNAEATLLYQLDTAAMPPYIRQVFDRHVQDFQQNPLSNLWLGVQCQLQQVNWVRAYVFEPQRKAAIGYCAIALCRNGRGHIAQMTVHPAYTWLYAELIAYMARQTQTVPAAPLYLMSADYQSEREDYLRQVDADPIEQTLMLSRSVWHKIRETKVLSLDSLPLSDVLQGLQPNHTPIPGRMTTWPTLHRSSLPSHWKANPFIKPDERNSKGGSNTGESRDSGDSDYSNFHGSRG